MCSCGRPQNPDRQIVQCPKCSEWLHAKCVEEDALDRYLAEHGPEATNEKVDTTKKAWTKDITSKTERMGVTAVFKVETDKSPAIAITDGRGADPVTDQAEVKCLSCNHKIE